MSTRLASDARFKQENHLISYQSIIASSLPLRQARSVELLSAAEENNVSLSLQKRIRSFISSKRSSVISYSEFLTSLLLSNVSSSVTEIIDGSLKSKIWGKENLNFDWTLSRKKLFQAEKMIAYLRKIITVKWTSRSITVIVLFTHCYVIANISIINEYFTFAELEQKRVDDLMRKPSTECIWNLLSSDFTCQRSFPVVQGGTRFDIAISSPCPYNLQGGPQYDRFGSR